MMKQWRQVFSILLACAFCSAHLFAAPDATDSTPVLTQKFVDDVWADHLVLEAENREFAPERREGFYRLALRIRPRHQDAIKGMAGYYAEQEEWVMAAMAAGYGATLHPDVTTFRHELQAYREHIPGHPLDGYPSSIEGEIDDYYEQVRTGEKESITGIENGLRALLAEHPHHRRVISYLATLHFLNQEWPMCAMMNLHAVNSYPTDMAFVENLATSFHRLGELRLCLNVVQDGLKSDPSNAKLAAQGARVALESADFTLAVELHALWAKLEKGNPRAHLGHALALYGTGNRRAATREFGIVARIAPRMPTSYYYLAKIAAQDEDAHTAMAWLKKYAALVSQDQLQSVVKQEPFQDLPGLETLLTQPQDPLAEED